MAAAETTDEAPEEEGGIRNLLSDGLFTAIGDGLRKYPEVEWACQVSDGSPRPVVGVRVDPSFTTRAEEITQEVIKIGKAKGTPLTVLLLNDPQTMRDARAEGELFFPWRKKKK